LRSMPGEGVVGRGPRVQNPLWLIWPRAKARAEARCRGPAQLDLAADGADWTEG